MSEPLLTITIPTYNRLACLRLLLDTLIQQMQEIGVLGKQCQILVCNNASIDGTTEYLNELRHINGIEVIHHAVNCGGDANILFCFQAAVSKYVWIIGDDDVPLGGAVAAMVECLERDAPDLLYLPQLWVGADEVTGHIKNKINSKRVASLGRMALAVKANVYVTFISAWVINVAAYHTSALDSKYDRYRGTSFTQLEWILTLIKGGRKFICMQDIFLVCRGGSSGGYSLFEVFSSQFNRIVDDKLIASPLLHHFFSQCMLWRFIPGLVWGMRKNAIGNFDAFDKEKTFAVLKSAYHNNAFFLLVVTPMIFFNKPIAWCFKSLAAVMARIWFYLWKIRVS